MFTKQLRTAFVFIMATIGSAAPFGLASYHDPVPLHSVYGMDHTPVPSKRSRMQFSLSPYHLAASNAKDHNHAKVPLGDRLGRIDMLAAMLGDGPSPYTKKFGDDDSTSTSSLHAAYDALADHVAGTGEATEAHPDDDIFIGSTYESLDSSDARYGWGKYRTSMSHRRIGLRGVLDYSFSNGIGVAVKSGIAEYSLVIVDSDGEDGYKANPTYDVSTEKWLNGATTAADGTAVKVMQSKLMSQSRRQAIGADLGIDFAGTSTTGAEDTNVEVYWRKGYEMRDDEGDKVLTAIPYLSLGLTLPTAEKKKVDRLYDLALGNDGFYGFTGQAEVSFDFPGMLKAGFGGAITVFNDDNIGKQFVPTSEYQSTLYPWQTTVTKRPGALWKVYGTLKAHHFIDYLSCYVSYIIVSHEKDSITLSGLDKSLYLPKKLAEDGQYSAQLLHLGFDYEVTSALRFGLSLQSVFAGKRIWKSVTVAGSLSFVF